NDHDRCRRAPGAVAGHGVHHAGRRWSGCPTGIRHRPTRLELDGGGRFVPPAAARCDAAAIPAGTPRGDADDGAAVPLSRRGVPAVERLAALVLSGVSPTAGAGGMRRFLSGYRATVQSTDRRQNLRIAAAFPPAELRTLDASDGDIVAMSRTAL